MVVELYHVTIGRQWETGPPSYSLCNFIGIYDYFKIKKVKNKYRNKNFLNMLTFHYKHQWKNSKCSQKKEAGLQ